MFYYVFATCCSLIYRPPQVKQFIYISRWISGCWWVLRFINKGIFFPFLLILLSKTSKGQLWCFRSGTWRGQDKLAVVCFLMKQIYKYIYVSVRQTLSCLVPGALQDENNQIVGQNGRRNYTLLVGHSGPVYSATFSPPGDYVLSSSADTTSMHLSITPHVQIVLSYQPCILKCSKAVEHKIKRQSRVLQGT